MTIREALDGFAAGWVAARPVTPRTSYERTLRVLAFQLERAGVDLDGPLATLSAAQLEGFVAWHASSGLGADADATRRVAVHVARLGDHLASLGRPDLALGRDALRAAAERALAAGTAERPAP